MQKEGTFMPTPHIEAEKEKIARDVIMPGDPLRAKFIAENFLDDVECINHVRNILAYTGTYKGKRVTVFASGMGMGSMGIYSYELFHYYDVDRIIRIGTAGSYDLEIPVLDVVLAKRSYTDSNYAMVESGYPGNYMDASRSLNEKIIHTAERLGKKIHLEDIYTTDVFYPSKEPSIIKKYSLKAVEMESFVLFHHALLHHKEASCILTISNHFVTGEETSSQMREKGFTDMVILALESCL